MARFVLVIDDEVSIRNSLSGALKDEGFRVSVAASGREGIEAVKQERPDVVVLDIWMTEMDGLETLRLIRQEWPDQPVIMMSGHGTIDTAVKATKLGAFDFVEKPLSLDRLLLLINNACNANDLAKENSALRKQVQSQKQIVGKSAATLAILDIIAQVAPTTGSVLITGENGTGKELVANAIHAGSLRASRPFVEVNCAAIPEELIESELFGHERGAFTGATQLRRGKFDQANGGTLFLDEIGDMSLKTQAKILRIIQEQKFERVGGSQTISVDVRIVAATNKDLRAEIQKGGFREDLFYRLNVIPIQVAPLRDRAEDIPILAQHFVKEFASIHGKPGLTLAPEALSALSAYSWPGNVRELRNLIERIAILTKPQASPEIGAAEIFAHLSQGQEAQAAAVSVPAGSKNLREARQDFEKDFILRTLKENDWNVSKSAEVLGVERSHLHRKIKAFGIEGKWSGLPGGGGGGEAV